MAGAIDGAIGVDRALQIAGVGVHGVATDREGGEVRAALRECEELGDVGIRKGERGEAVGAGLGFAQALLAMGVEENHGGVGARLAGGGVEGADVEFAVLTAGDEHHGRGEENDLRLAMGVGGFEQIDARFIELHWDFMGFPGVHFAGRGVVMPHSHYALRIHERDVGVGIAGDLLGLLDGPKAGLGESLLRALKARGADRGAVLGGELQTDQVE